MSLTRRQFIKHMVTIGGGVALSGLPKGVEGQDKLRIDYGQETPYSHPAFEPYLEDVIMLLPDIRHKVAPLNLLAPTSGEAMDVLQSYLNAPVSISKWKSGARVVSCMPNIYEGYRTEASINAAISEPTSKWLARLNLDELALLPLPQNFSTYEGEANFPFHSPDPYFFFYYPHGNEFIAQELPYIMGEIDQQKSNYTPFAEDERSFREFNLECYVSRLGLFKNIDDLTYGESIEYLEEILHKYRFEGPNAVLQVLKIIKSSTGSTLNEQELKEKWLYFTGGVFSIGNRDPILVPGWLFRPIAKLLEKNHGAFSQNGFDQTITLMAYQLCFDPNDKGGPNSHVDWLNRQIFKLSVHEDPTAPARFDSEWRYALGEMPANWTVQISARNEKGELEIFMANCVNQSLQLGVIINTALAVLKEKNYTPECVFIPDANRPQFSVWSSGNGGEYLAGMPRVYSHQALVMKDRFEVPSPEEMYAGVHDSTYNREEGLRRSFYLLMIPQNIDE